jgi:hypothetical protein
MGRFTWMNRVAVVTGAAAALLIGTTPAHAYKLADGELEMKTLGFLDFMSVSGNSTSAADDAASGFHLSRAYFEMRYHPEKSTTYRITLDSKGNDKNNFVKYLYGQIEYADGQSVKFGLGQTPVIDYYENDVWGHRYVDKTFVDSIGAMPSSDLGVSFLGKAADMVDYQVSFMNGEGYNYQPGSGAPPSSGGANGSGYAIEGRVEAHAAGAHLGVYGMSNQNLNGDDTLDRQMEGVYGIYGDGWGNVAAQYLAIDDGDNTSAFNSGKGFSVLANGNIPAGDNSRGFVRYDSFKAKDTNADPVKKLIVGVETDAHKNCKVAVAYTSVDPGGTADTINTIGVYAQLAI